MHTRSPPVHCPVPYASPWCRRCVAAVGSPACTWGAPLLEPPQFSGFPGPLSLLFPASLATLARRPRQSSHISLGPAPTTPRPNAMHCFLVRLIAAARAHGQYRPPTAAPRAANALCLPLSSPGHLRRQNGSDAASFGLPPRNGAVLPHPLVGGVHFVFCHTPPWLIPTHPKHQRSTTHHAPPMRPPVFPTFYSAHLPPD